MCKKIILFSLFAMLVACSKSDSTDDFNNVQINRWIHDNLSTYYLWSDQLPPLIWSDDDPETYFKSLLYKKGEIGGDRFSWIQANYLELLNSLSGITTTDLGFEWNAYRTTDKNVVIQIQYVKKNTPAAQLGLKRGDCISAVNGQKLSLDNWRIINSSDKSVRLSIINFQDNSTKDINLPKLSNFAEHPILLDTVYSVDSKKIAYLVYNFFAADFGNNKGSYDLNLNEVFGRFKSESVSDLIIDLRYNGGGSIKSAIYLASMAVKNLDTKNICNVYKYNAKIESALIKDGQKIEDFFTNEIVRGTDRTPINNTATERVYVLTGSGTASASEMVINSLKPYMEVIVIGDTTVGKTAGSISIYDDKNPKNKWGMQPIILKYYNAERKADFEEGFVPTIVDKDNNLSKKQLGALDEPLLSKAINHITGKKSVVVQSAFNPSTILGSSFADKAWQNTAYLDSNK